jgi:hypothetical protein
MLTKKDEEWDKLLPVLQGIDLNRLGQLSIPDSHQALLHQLSYVAERNLSRMAPHLEPLLFLLVQQLAFDLHAATRRNPRAGFQTWKSLGRSVKMGGQAWIHARKKFGPIRHKIGARPEKILSDPEQKIKTVCRICNNGWMSRL